jgi:hypothetical protein
MPKPICEQLKGKAARTQKAQIAALGGPFYPRFAYFGLSRAGFWVKVGFLALENRQGGITTGQTDLALGSMS